MLINTIDNSKTATHILNTTNPHSVTKTQVGLGNVDNTTDLDKPVSSATQSALDLKVDKELKTGSEEDYKVLTDNNLTDTLKTNYDTAYTNNHTHNNKTALDNVSGVNTGDQDLSSYEINSNKVTSISSISTDVQYPTAKCVYDEISAVKLFDKVIRTQAEFETLIASSTWLDAKSVAFIGDGGTLEFTLNIENNTGILIPQTVKRISGFNSAKITITNYSWDWVPNNIGAIRYYSKPTTNDYLFENIIINTDGIFSTAMRNIINISNVEITNNSTNSHSMSSCQALGFSSCDNLFNCKVNCFAEDTYAGNSSPKSYGFANCLNIVNCTGNATATGPSSLASVTGYGFYQCSNIINCTGTGLALGDNTSKVGYGFYKCSYGSNNRDGGSTTSATGGTMTKWSSETND